jgi:hypothetical protein
MVEGCHEFVAAGITVHNCVWAFTELFLEADNEPGYLIYDDPVRISPV